MFYNLWGDDSGFFAVLSCFTVSTEGLWLGVAWRGRGGQEQSVSSGTCSLAASLLSWLVLAQICIPHNALSIVIEASVFPEDLLPLEHFSS